MSNKLILIKNGTLVSKDHNSEIKDILVEGDRIKKIESNIIDNENWQIIDAKGKIVSPGFINIHSHADSYFTVKEHFKLFEPMLLQGITTELGGNCGLSIFPITGKNIESFNNYINLLVYRKIDYEWGGYKEYKEFIKGNILMNIANLVGCGALRVNVAGFEKNLTQEQLNEMDNLLIQALDEGCFGLSSGLIYMPGTFSTTEELIRLAKVAKKRNPDALYATHMRGYSENLIYSLKEAIEVGEKTGIKVECSHLGPEAPKFNDRVYEVIELIDNARKRGIDIAYDSLSYPNGCTTVMVIFPPWSYENGIDKFLKDLKNESFFKKMIEYMNTYVPKWPSWEGDGWTDNYINTVGWENMFVLGSRNKELFGKSFIQIARERKEDIYLTVRDVMIEENADINLYFRGPRGAVSFEDDEDLKYFDMLVESKLSHVAVDALFSKDGGITYTPYMYGAFPRIISRYVKKKKTLTLKDAIERFTSNTADRIGIKKRGYLREGYFADIVVFDYDNYIDYPAILKEQKYTTGVEYLLINGRLSIEKGKINNLNAGYVISSQ